MDFHGVKMAVTHFVTQFTHVSRHFGVYSRKQKNIFRENCFENIVSDLKNKNGLCVHKTNLRKSAKKCKKLKRKTMKMFKIFGGFRGQNYFFW